MEIYHGSREIVEFPEIRITKYTKDFSWGFYCTNNYSQAQKRANRGNFYGVVNVYEYKEDTSLKILRFDSTDERWLDFVAKCRKGYVHDYDIVEGPMADDSIWNYVDDYLNGYINKEEFFVLAKFKHPTHQISFHSLKALKCLQFLRSDDLHDKKQKVQ